MPDLPLPEGIRTALAEAADCVGADFAQAEVVHQHSNVAVALPDAGLLVRIASNPDALDGVTASVKITRWLAKRGFPCVEPAEIDQPFVIGGQVVSVWRLLDTAAGPPGTAGELANLLSALHARPAPPFPLPMFEEPLSGVARAAEGTDGALSKADRAWLLERIAQLRQRWERLDFVHPAGLIHGDAHSNNLIRTKAGGVVLGDWDHVALGPREWDLIQPYYMTGRFDRHGPGDIEEFAKAYGWDVRNWSGFETLIEVREVSGLSPYIRKAPAEHVMRAEVAYRLDTIRERNTAARWNSPSTP